MTSPVTRADARPARPLRAGLVLTAAAALVLAGCSADSEDSAGAPAASVGTRSSAPAADAPADGRELIAAHGLEGMDAKEAIEHLDTLETSERDQDLIASVRTDVLLLRDRADETVQATLPMPEDEFYLSFAPYVSQTHDCFYHSLTTCVGELQNEDVTVTITQDDGTVLVDEATTTYDNGFYGVWLPRDVQATLTVESGGRTGTATIGTGEDDLTCLTTLPLT